MGGLGRVGGGLWSHVRAMWGHVRAMWDHVRVLVGSCAGCLREKSCAGCGIMGCFVSFSAMLPLRGSIAEKETKHP